MPGTVIIVSCAIFIQTCWAEGILFVSLAGVTFVLCDPSWFLSSVFVRVLGVPFSPDAAAL